MFNIRVDYRRHLYKYLKSKIIVTYKSVDKEKIKIIIIYANIQCKQKQTKILTNRTCSPGNLWFDWKQIATVLKNAFLDSKSHHTTK